MISTSYLPSDSTASMRRFFVADTTSELTGISTAAEGDLGYSKQSGAYYYRGASAWRAAETTANKGVANGYAGLDGSGLVPTAQLPGLPAAWGAITGTLSSQTDLQNALNSKEAVANKGIANGYAGLGADGKVPAAQLPASGGGPASCRKSGAAQTATTATLANVTGMSFSVTAGVYYHFKFLVSFRSSVATVGLKLGLTFPAVTRFSGSCRIPIAAAGAGGELQGPISASGGSVSGSAVPAINTDYCAICEGVILASANGTLQLQFAAETTGATVTLQPETVGFLYTVA